MKYQALPGRIPQRPFPVQKTDRVISDRWLKIIGVPLIAVLILVATGSDDLTAPDFQISAFITRVVLTLLITFLVWEGNVVILRKMQARLPWYKSPRKRLLVQGALSLAYSIAVVSLPIILLRQPFSPGSDFTLVLILGLVIAVGVNAIYIGVYFFEQWLASLTESEQLKRQNAESRFEALKNQVNPHFLFNSLNTLMTLIDEDPRLAGEFTQELANVYRYVLQSRERELVSVETELRFVNSFAFLLQKRFDNNVRIEIDVPAHVRQKSVVPLSLQMLIENAVKHNVVSAESPLHITINTGPGEHRLVVRNSVHRKTVHDKSTKVGLQNIIDRYAYLSAEAVHVDAGEQQFSVELPLL